MNSRCYLSRLSSAHEAACGSPPSASAREIRVPRVGFAPGTPSRDASPTHGRPVRPRASADSFASKSAAAMMRHALSRADFAPAPARGVSTPPARLARRPTARVVPRAGGSSAPTLDEAFAALDARRVASGSETALPPFQSALERDAGESALFSRETTSETDSGHTTTAPPLPRPPTSANSRQLALVGVSPETRPLAPPSLASAPPSRVFFGAPGAPALSLALSFAACVFGGALSAFLLACVPTLRAIAAAADEIADLAASVREEVPDTLAAVRVSGLELTDCLEEVGELTHDVGSGIKGTGKAVAYTVDTAAVLGKAAATQVRKAMPEVRRARERATPAARRALENASASVDDALRRSDETLRKNADTEAYSEPVVAAAARATKSGVRYARGAIRAAGVAKQVGRVVKTVRGVADAGAAEAARRDDGDGDGDGDGDSSDSERAAR